MVSDHVHLIRHCFVDEFSEPSCIKETSRCKYQRLWWGALVGAVDDVFQRDNVCRIFVSINSGSNSTATEFISCKTTVLRLQSTILYTYRSTERLDCFLMKTQHCTEHGSMPFVHWRVKTKENIIFFSLLCSLQPIAQHYLNRCDILVQILLHI
jgi:hypothetical protein